MESIYSFEQLEPRLIGTFGDEADVPVRYTDRRGLLIEEKHLFQDAQLHQKAFEAAARTVPMTMHQMLDFLEIYASAKQWYEAKAKQ